MKRIIFLVFACLIFLHFPLAHPCFADEVITIEKLLANMQKAEGNIQDVSYKEIMNMPM